VERLDSRVSAYAERVERITSLWWKDMLDAQRPYRRHIEGLELGRTLDIGCGIGRNLAVLPAGSVGIDPDRPAVERARARGCVAYEPDAFTGAPEAVPGSFDSLLVAHVLEHLTAEKATELLYRWLPYVRPRGRVVLITPQEVGHAADPTHVTFQDFAALERLTLACDLRPERHYSFPFPRPMGRLFIHNEFVSVVQVREDGIRRLRPSQRLRPS